MAWKKIELNRNADQILMIQNSSVVPHSLVEISFTETNSPGQSTFILTGPNTWSGRVKKGTNVFYQESQGGIFTYSAYDIEPLKNYDIPTVHNDITLTTENKILQIPEGAYFVIQNKSDEPLFMSIVGEGTFTLIKNQMLSFTFTKDTEVKLVGNNQHVSYLYGEAPSLTQLSTKTKELIEEIHAGWELLKREAATRNELYAVENRTFYNKYSEYSEIQMSSIPSNLNLLSFNFPIFEIDMYYNSSPLSNGNTIDILVELMYKSNDVVKRSIFELGITYSENGDGCLSRFSCDDDIIRKLFRSVTMNYDRTNNTCSIIISIATWYNTSSTYYDTHSDLLTTPILAKCKIKSENAVWKLSNKQNENDINIVYFVENYPNKDVDFLTDKGYDMLVNQLLSDNTITRKTTVFVGDFLTGVAPTTDNITIMNSDNTVSIVFHRKGDGIMSVSVSIGGSYNILNTDKLIGIYFLSNRIHKTDYSMYLNIMLLKVLNHPEVRPVNVSGKMTYNVELSLNKNGMCDKIFDKMLRIVEEILNDSKSFSIIINLDRVGDSNE